MDRVSDWNEKMITEFREGNGTAGRFGRSLVIMHTIGEQWTVVRPSDAEHTSAFEQK